MQLEYLGISSASVHNRSHQDAARLDIKSASASWEATMLRNGDPRSGRNGNRLHNVTMLVYAAWVFNFIVQNVSNIRNIDIYGIPALPPTSKQKKCYIFEIYL